MTSPRTAPFRGKHRPIPDAVAKRAATKWVEDEAGCRISTYSVASHGYAQIGWQLSDGSRRCGGTTAHRAAWVYAYGQIPDGMTIDHLCKNRRCVHIDHLRLLTNYENARRTSGRDWPLGECRNGHSNDHLVSSGGHVQCLICLRSRQARSNAKRRSVA